LTDEEKKDASRIPLFSEVLDMLNDKTGLIVEIKQDSDEMIEKILIIFCLNRVHLHVQHALTSAQNIYNIKKSHAYKI